MQFVLVIYIEREIVGGGDILSESVVSPSQRLTYVNFMSGLCQIQELGDKVPIMFVLCRNVINPINMTK